LKESLDYLKHLQFDGRFKHETLNKLILFSKIRCMKSDLLKCTGDILFGLSKNCNKTFNDLFTVLLNDSNLFYSKNPECANIPLWKVIRDKIEFEYNIKFDLEYIPENVIIVKQVLDYINKDVVTSKTNTSSIESKQSSVNATIEQINKNTIEIISKTNSLPKNDINLEFSVSETGQSKNNIKYKVVPKVDDVMINYDTFVLNKIHDIVQSLSIIEKNVELKDNIVIISNKNCNTNNNE